eukprot:10981713-Alexandrium_andersonii.AAC.1
MEHACRHARTLLTGSTHAMLYALPARFMPAHTRTGCTCVRVPAPDAQLDRRACAQSSCTCVRPCKCPAPPARCARPTLMQP